VVVELVSGSIFTTVSPEKQAGNGQSSEPVKKQFKPLVKLSMRFVI
jgi:hypothetical protein